MKILKNGTIISVTPKYVLVQGKSISGKFGVWLLKRRIRIYDMEPTLRYKIFSKKRLLETAKSI